MDNFPLQWKIIFPLFKDFVSNDFSLTNLQDGFNYLGRIEYNSDTIFLEIETLNNIILNDSTKMNVLGLCDWEKAKTINNFLDKLGFDSEDDFYINLIETSLNECGWECGNCINPICVFSKLHELVDNQQDYSIIHEAFLMHIMNLGGEELYENINYFSEYLSDAFFLSENSQDPCIDLSTFSNVLTQLIENPNFLNEVDLSPCSGADLIFDGETEFCNASFGTCDISESTLIKSSGISCFKIKLNIETFEEILNFSPIVFLLANDENCSDNCVNGIASSLNKSYSTAQEIIDSGILPNYENINSLCLVILNSELKQILKNTECAGHNSIIPNFEAKFTSNSSYYNETYETQFHVFKESIFEQCN